MQQKKKSNPSTSSKSKARSLRLTNQDWEELTYAAKLHGRTINDEIKYRCHALAVEVPKTAEIVDLDIPINQRYFNGKGCSVCRHEFETYTNPPTNGLSLAEAKFCPHCGRKLL